MCNDYLIGELDEAKYYTLVLVRVHIMFANITCFELPTAGIWPPSAIMSRNREWLWRPVITVSEPLSRYMVYHIFLQYIVHGIFYLIKKNIYILSLSFFPYTKLFFSSEINGYFFLFKYFIIKSNVFLFSYRFISIRCCRQ